MLSKFNQRRRASSTHALRISPIGTTSILFVAMIFAAVVQGLVQTITLLTAAAMLVFFLTIFYLVFRLRWHKRWRDPSLTLAQLSAAMLLMLTAFTLDRSVQLILGPFLLAVFVQASLRVKPATLGVLSAVCLIGYLALMFASGSARAEQFQRDVLTWVAVAVTMPLMCTMGAQIYGLRQALKSTRHQLLQIEEKAIRDELTGLYNRRQLVLELDSAIAHASQHGTTFCLAIIDVDHFKSINDKQGHLVGDVVLREFARVASDSIRNSDIFGRYGGDEFMQILRDTELKGAVMHAERLRVHAHFLDLRSIMPAKSISLSIGIAQYRAGENAESLIERADAGLYLAKQRGRNRVEWIDTA